MTPTYIADINRNGSLHVYRILASLRGFCDVNFEYYKPVNEVIRYVQIKVFNGFQSSCRQSLISEMIERIKNENQVDH